MNKCPLRVLKTIYTLHCCRSLRKKLILPKESLPRRGPEEEAGRVTGTAKFSMAKNFPCMELLKSLIADSSPGSAYHST